MEPVRNKAHLLLLPIAFCGFAVAQPLYNLLLQTPVLLLARQNTLIDVWVLALVLSLVLPLLLALPGWQCRRRWPGFSSLWCWSVSSIFAALFVAQLLQKIPGLNWILFVIVAGVTGALVSWVLLFSRWSILSPVLAGLAIIFPLWFLLFSPVMEQVDNFAVVSPDRKNPNQPLPDIVFIILDELPLATLVDGTGQIDESLFPGFARLQSMSNWYYDTTSVSDGTVAAVPAILTGQYPDETRSGLTIATQPVNLFTILRHHYAYNVAEAVTRFCPRSLCPRIGPGHYSRIKALLLDLTAVYLHRVVPDEWHHNLPSVSNNWSGFFAEPQMFFPEGWMKHAGAQTEIDRPGYFRKFTDSIRKDDKPVLNFMHILFPHEPNAYLPSGENYGLVWMRGQKNEIWGNVEWGIISGKQRHYLQVQYMDQLLNNLLDRLQNQNILNESMIVMVADHGISFALNDTRRTLSSVNMAAMLRVPMFIKFPRQLNGRRIDHPVMTIDILPTVLAALGFSPESLDLDGIDLESTATSKQRYRLANSHHQPELGKLNETDLDIRNLVEQNRAQLKLDDPDAALWEIGPYDHLRGQVMEAVCEKSPADIKVYFGDLSPLPNANPNDTVRAYVVGTFTGEAAVTDSRPFLITNNGLIIASGNTWVMDKYPKFFAMVKPKYVKQHDWKPRAWLVEGNQCFGWIE